MCSGARRSLIALCLLADRVHDRARGIKLIYNHSQPGARDILVAKKSSSAIVRAEEAQVSESLSELA